MSRNPYSAPGPTARTSHHKTLSRLTAGAGVVALAAGLSLIGTPAASARTAPTAAHPLKVRPSHATAAPQIIGGALINHGGPEQTMPKVYVDYWGWGSDPSGEQAYLNRFLASVGGTSWLATVDQYGGSSPLGLLAGTWSDPAAIPAGPSDGQIQAEAAAAASHFGTGTSVNVQIVVATPTGHSTAGFGTQYCAYHGAVAALPNVTYTDLPYMTDAGANCGEDSVNGAGGILDGVSIVEGHELAETITDPLLNAWYDAGGNEIGDKCAWSNLANVAMSGGSFAMQPLWSNAANGCVMSTSSNTPLVLGALGTNGEVNAKQGGLLNNWVDETGGVKQVAVATDPVHGPLIAVLDTNGEVWAKEGGLSTTWVLEISDATQIAVASDASHGPLISFIDPGGTVYAKEGSLTAGWVAETGGAAQISVASDPTNGPLIAVRNTSGVVSAKEGSLTAGWVTETGNATQIAVASDASHGPLISYIDTSGTVYTKEGGLSTTWVAETGGAAQIAVASDTSHGPLIAVRNTSGVVSAKEGSLTAGWVTETGNAAQISVASDAGTGPVIAVVDTSGGLSAKQGGLSTLWAYESGNMTQVSVAG